MHSIESRCAVGPENKLFAGVCVHFSAWKCYISGAVKGLKVCIMLSGTNTARSINSAVFLHGSQQEN